MVVVVAAFVQLVGNDIEDDNDDEDEEALVSVVDDTVKLRQDVDVMAPPLMFLDRNRAIRNVVVLQV